MVNTDTDAGQEVENLRALFAQWQAEDDLMTLEEIAAAEAAWASVEEGLLTNRLAFHIPDVADHA